MSWYVVNHVGRHGSCFAETGWSEQKLETQRETGSGDAALLRRAVHKLGCQPRETGSTQEWWSLSCQQTQPGPADGGQMLPSASDRARGCSPQASLPAAVTLAAASILKAERA